MNMNKQLSLKTTKFSVTKLLSVILLAWLCCSANIVSAQSAHEGRGTQPIPHFFDGEVPLDNGWYWLQFPSTGQCFGYYNKLYFPGWFYHQDMGWEFFTDANDGVGGGYLYDSASQHTWYTSPMTFPYLYDQTLQSWLYYLRVDSCRYSSNPRWFYDFATNQWITM